MDKIYLGVDVGSSKTHALIVDAAGRLLGFGEGGAGNHEVVGYDGLKNVLDRATAQALQSAALLADQISGAGYGVAGYDWPSQRQPILQAIAALGLKAPLELVNDVTLGLLAGSSEGWGVAVVSGAGCNCRGWDRQRRREGRVTGNGFWMGEGAGASELVARAVQAVAHEWTRRGSATQLTPAFLAHTASASLAELLEGLATGQKALGPEAALLVFQAAYGGDSVAVELIEWAGRELGELAKCVIRQLEFEALEFEVVMIGSMFEGGAMLVEPMRRSIQAYAPGARLVRLSAPPVIGAVLLGMEAAGVTPAPELRQALRVLALRGQTTSK